MRFTKSKWKKHKNDKVHSTCLRLVLKELKLGEVNQRVVDISLETIM